MMLSAPMDRLYTPSVPSVVLVKRITHTCDRPSNWLMKSFASSCDISSFRTSVASSVTIDRSRTASVGICPGLIGFCMVISDMRRRNTSWLKRYSAEVPFFLVPDPEGLSSLLELSLSFSPSSVSFSLSLSLLSDEDEDEEDGGSGGGGGVIFIVRHVRRKGRFT